MRPLAAVLALAACEVSDVPLQPESVMAVNAASAAVGPNARLEQQLTAVRRLVAPYHSFDQAQLAGYTVPILPCRENPQIGAMGEHYLNPAYVDGVVDALQPEVLVYEPQKNGGRRFVAVEYIIPFAVLPPTAAPPTLFGQEFLLNFGDQVWMQHVWLGRHNHDGMFATWNPQVSCQFATAAE